jgi:hypothetical protein
MKQAQKFILWGTGVFLLINLVAIGCSWWYFGYLDGQIVWEMTLVALPPVIVALGSYFLLGIEVNRGRVTDTPKVQHTHHHGVPHEKPSH